MGGGGGGPNRAAPARSLIVVALIVVALLLVACSRDQSADPVNSESGAGETTEVTTTTVLPEQADKAANGSTTTVVASDSVVERPAAPAGPPSDPPGPWIGTSAMTDDRIEVVWAWAAGDEPEAFGIYRFAHKGSLPGDPDTITLSTGELIFTGTDSPEQITSFNDTDVETGTFYTYILDLPATDGAAAVRRWTTGLAVTDTTPPTAVVGLVGEWNDDGVFLTWRPSTDNVEFASYSVSVVDDDGELVYLGGGADPSLANFHDPTPASNPTTYAVEAVDFHDNRTEPATITVGR